MSFGDRVRFFRNLRGYTMKTLGKMVGFSERTADIRISQYESNSRIPRPDMREKLSQALNVSPQALDVPDIDTDLGVCHTLLALEDKYELHPIRLNGNTFLVISHTPQTDTISRFIETWADQQSKYFKGEITKEEYIEWKCHYPDIAPTGPFRNISPSYQDLLAVQATYEREAARKKDTEK